jgi:RND family efflux transporter MFP subunit
MVEQDFIFPDPMNGRFTMKRHALLVSLVLSAAAFACVGQTTTTPGTSSMGASGDMMMQGQTEPAARVEVPAGMRSMILASVDVKEGQLVKKGEQLAKLDDAIQVKQVEMARAEASSDVKIREAEVALDFAKVEYERIQQVAAAGEAEKRQKKIAVDRYALAVQAAKEEQKKANIKLQQEEITLKRMTIVSPIDGAVLRVNKRAGEQTDDLPLIVVVQTSKLQAVFFPAKQLFGKIKVGDKVNLKFATDPVTQREATVVTVDPIIEQSLFRVKFEVDNSDAKIPAGTPSTWAWGGK